MSSAESRALQKTYPKVRTHSLEGRPQDYAETVDKYLRRQPFSGGGPPPPIPPDDNTSGRRGWGDDEWKFNPLSPYFIGSVLGATEFFFFFYQLISTEGRVPLWAFAVSLTLLAGALYSVGRGMKEDAEDP